MSKGKRYERSEKINKKKVLGTVITLIVIIMFFISINKIFKTSKDTDEKININGSFFTVYTNNKWGVINGQGDIVIEPIYEEMILIPDNSKPVFIVITELNKETGEYKTKVLNEKNEFIFEKYDLVEAIDNEDTSNNIFYDSNLLKVKLNNKYGLINYNGLVILPIEYDEITAMQGILNSYIIKKDNKYGLCNSLGDIVITVAYKNITALSNKYEDGYIVTNENDVLGIVGVNKKTIITPQYKEIAKVFGNDMYVVKFEDWKVVNKSNEDILNLQDMQITQINGDNFVIKKNNKYGIIDKTGKEIIAPQYQSLNLAFSNNYIAKKDEKYGIIDDTNSMKVDFIYQQINYIEQAHLFEAVNEELKSIMYNSNFEIKLEGILSKIDTKNGFIRMRMEDNYKYYNFKLEEKQSSEVLPQRAIYLSKKDGKYGYVDKDNNIVVDYIYEDATEQNIFGFAAVKKDGKWGSIDKIGKPILDTILSLEDNIIIDFIGKWHLGRDINMNYYTDVN